VTLAQQFPDLLFNGGQDIGGLCLDHDEVNCTRISPVRAAQHSDSCGRQRYVNDIILIEAGNRRSFPLENANDSEWDVFDPDGAAHRIDLIEKLFDNRIPH
jgi:hypothetical protein